MTLFKEITDFLGNPNVTSVVKSFTVGDNSSSLSRKSKRGVFQFSVITSKSIGIETSQMINKALERNFATFVLITISLNGNIDKGKSVHDRLGALHNSSPESLNPQGAMVSLSSLQQNGISAVGESFIVGLSDDDLEDLQLFAGTDPEIMLENMNQQFTPVNHLVMESLNDILKPTNKYLRYRPVQEAQDPYLKDLVNSSDPAEVRTAKMSAMMVNNVLDTREKFNNDGTPKVKSGNGYELPREILKDNDARKANELVPTMIQARFNTETSSGESVSNDVLIGIKANMHPVTSEEVVSNIVSMLKKRDVVFRFLKWTTGEISFVKDFLLGISEIREDVANMTNGQSKLWSRLKSMGRRRKIPAIFTGNIIPNSTIVMSMEEANFIKYNYGFDLEKEANIIELMRKYFLLGFVIVDVASQQAKFLFDGDDLFQTLTFGALEKENTNRSDLKELMKVVNRASY